MAKKYDMRLNIYLDEKDPKDKILIDFLNKKYSAVGFIKETIYELATGGTVHGVTSVQAVNSEPLMNQDEQEFEPIKGISDIEI
ncbi:hypothetical protein [Clostridium botulinum]|uniref:hypothetical protein n=1 Tax=Clostridium botulinum TaxID=1491 RepID=UPI001401307A|nr:hypothetical protein [Clostridium botulinum]MBY6918166.1 hypothetical protein [Clostridium botulinum]NFQ39424.1 hypothetical protein [Clostridium botulinum]